MLFLEINILFIHLFQFLNYFWHINNWYGLKIFFLVPVLVIPIKMLPKEFTISSFYNNLLKSSCVIDIYETQLHLVQNLKNRTPNGKGKYSQSSTSHCTIRKAKTSTCCNCKQISDNNFATQEKSIDWLIDCLGFMAYQPLKVI